MMKYIGKCICINVRGKKILVIGDLHLGYEEVLNEAGVFVTREMFKEMLGYLDRVFDRVGGVDYVVLLGDVKHNFGGILRQEWNDVLGLFDYLEGKLNGNGRIVITKGNHDNILEPIVRKREKVKSVEHFVIGEYCFVHGDKVFSEMNEGGIKYWIMGHGHPAIKLSDGIKVEKYKCFLVGKFGGREVVIVPSFFEYSEGSDPRDSGLGMAWNFDYGKFDVRVVESGELKVLDFGKLGRLK